RAARAHPEPGDVRGEVVLEVGELRACGSERPAPGSGRTESGAELPVADPRAPEAEPSGAEALREALEDDDAPLGTERARSPARVREREEDLVDERDGSVLARDREEPVEPVEVEPGRVVRIREEEDTRTIFSAL